MKKKAVAVYCIIIILLLTNIFQFVWNIYGSRLPMAAVPDENTALKIAEAIYLSAIDEDEMLNEITKVTFDDLKKVWYVQITPPEGYMGVWAYFSIRMSDGKVIEMDIGR